MKKIPPWGWALIAVGVGAAAWLYKKSKEAEKLREEKESSSESSTSPVIAGVEPEEYPYSIAGLGGGGAGASGAIGNAGESQQEFRELFTAQSEYEKQSQQAEHEFDASLLASIESANNALLETIKSGTLSAGSGGGAPATPSPGGTTAPPPVTHAPTCPSEYPLYNSANGPVGPHSCYRYSRDAATRCKDKRYPYDHAYQDGHHVCSPS